MKPRIIGIDIARALAVIGMIIVNFKTVLGQEGSGWLKSIAGIFDGKAAATFVVLAGVGIALMSNTAIQNKDHQKIKRTQKRIAKRAVFLFIVGLSYLAIWPADILHFYGIYMLLVLLLLKASPQAILTAAGLMIFAYPFLMMVFPYDLGWNFVSLDYAGFWTINGFFRNLFYNGFHPVIPWAAFMLIGLWLGKQKLNDPQFLKKTLWISLIVFSAAQLFSYCSILFLSENDPTTAEELKAILGTSPMPPLPIYMISGSSIALFVITACILLGKKYPESKTLLALKNTGQLALTFYVAHVVIGMGFVEIMYPEEMQKHSLSFSLIYALIFSACCIIFAILWRRTGKAGPLEWLMRKVTD